jgi:hypothetical protein
MAVHPLSTFTHAPKRSPTVPNAGNSIAFIDGFEFKSGYLNIKHNRPDLIILNKQQKQAHLLDIAVPNSHNITQTYNTKINKYLELSVAMRNLWCLEKNSILPLVISATEIVPQSLFKNLKILDLDNTLVVEIQKGILLYSCHIVRKFLNIDTEHNTQQSQNAEARRR